MSIETIVGPLKGVGAETISAGATDSTLTSGTYGNASFAVVSVTDANSVLITIQNDAGNAPADGSKGIYLDRSHGAYSINCDLSKVLIRRGGGSDCSINVNYFGA